MLTFVHFKYSIFLFLVNILFSFNDSYFLVYYEFGFGKLKHSFMLIIAKSTFATPVGDKTKALIAHFAHFGISIMFLVRVSTHAFDIIVGHILIALAIAPRTQAESCSNDLTVLVIFERMGTETSVRLNDVLAFGSLNIDPFDIDIPLFCDFRVFDFTKLHLIADFLLLLLHGGGDPACVHYSCF